MKKALSLLLSLLCVLTIPLCAFGGTDYDAVCPQWCAGELTFTAEGTYERPFYDVEMDVVFTHGAAALTVPAFWDGGSTWKVRFALTKCGEWNYETKCSNTSDTGLHGIKGTVLCTAYDGDLAIYQHGFVKTEPGKKYFVYDDGTPFFYLGDTHWGMASEELDSAGPHAGDIQTDSHFCYIVDKRAEQGFTVYQSEPIGATYNIQDGIDENDIAGFRYVDRQFDYIAKAGLLHANAELVFPGYLTESVYGDKAYFAKLARYWVARYCAYPVLWTLGQETDDTFYEQFTRENNPYKDMCRTINACDPYHHPISAHQEYAARDNVMASNSVFAGVEGHNWFAVQWSPSLTNQYDFVIPADFWNNKEGKPAILYEGRYENLWTKNFGARAQGWIGFLSGLYGYGYGCVDLWLYQSDYDTDTVSNDGIDTITPEDKAVPWSTALNFKTAEELGYMKTFLNDAQWWTLIPDFDSKSAFAANPLHAFFTQLKAIFTGSGSFIEKIVKFFRFPSVKPFYASARNENTVVIYFYNPGLAAGTVKGLQQGADYTVNWFNPVTGEYEEPETVTAKNGTVRISQKPTEGDWVLLMQKVSE